jgi:hypothetical protein
MGVLSTRQGVVASLPADDACDEATPHRILAGRRRIRPCGRPPSGSGMEAVGRHDDEGRDPSTFER